MLCDENTVFVKECVGLSFLGCYSPILVWVELRFRKKLPSLRFRYTNMVFRHRQRKCEVYMHRWCHEAIQIYTLVEVDAERQTKDQTELLLEKTRVVKIDDDTLIMAKTVSN